DLSLSTDLGLLAAGTHGRGVWELPLPMLPGPQTFGATVGPFAMSSAAILTLPSGAFSTSSGRSSLLASSASLEDATLNLKARAGDDGAYQPHHLGQVASGLSILDCGLDAAMWIGDGAVMLAST